MLKLYFSFLLAILIYLNVSAQSYDTYFIGNNSDTTSIPDGGVCLMGGATENDEAMKWFLQRANGGDVLVLRASGSDGYNDYFLNQLGIDINSVESIVFNDASASNELYIQGKISKAEAIWFAGGDQWNYVSYWRNTTIDSLINDAIENRNIVIGGTSAGMAILGSIYFSAENGTITSNEAINNPFDNNMTVDNTPFLNIPFLEDIITDTHYDNPDRKGRHISFIAKMLEENNIDAKGIACDEYTSVCIDENGIAKVFGEYPTEEDNAYFIQINCDVENNSPETYTSNTTLEWNQNGDAIKVYAIKGTQTGSNTFDLNTWKNGSGGEWQNWSITNGNVLEKNASAPNCKKDSIPNNISYISANSIEVFPNPFNNVIKLEIETKNINFEIYNVLGEKILAQSYFKNNTLYIDTKDFKDGIYFLSIKTKSGTESKKLVKR